MLPGVRLGRCPRLSLFCALSAIICTSLIFAQPALPKVVIVFDDLLRDPKYYETALSIPVSLDFSVIPGFDFSRADAEAVHAHGQEVMMHFPMQALKGNLPYYTFKLIDGMSANEIQYHLNESFRTVPYVVGLNNHMGSRASQNAALMATFMQCYKKAMAKTGQPGFFLDSKTIGHSQAGKEAEKAGIRTYYRDVFLDGFTDDAYLHKQLSQLVSIAQKRGYAIAICHVRPPTMRFMARELPKLQGTVQFVHLSSLYYPSDGRN